MRKHQSRRHLIIQGARYTWPQGVPPSAIFTEERRDEHSMRRKFDEAGRELYRTRFIYGSGVDLWLNGREITELREMARNVPHGVERWGHPQLPYEECHFVRGAPEVSQ